MRTDWRTWCTRRSTGSRSRRSRSARPGRSRGARGGGPGVVCVSWVGRVDGGLRSAQRGAAERLTRWDVCLPEERRPLVAGRVLVAHDAAALRVEVVELLLEPTLTGLAVGVALVVDRGTVHGAVRELVAAERRVRDAAVGGRRCAGRAYVVRLRWVGLVQQGALGVAEVRDLVDIAGEERPPVVPVVADGHVRPEVLDHWVERLHGRGHCIQADV